MNCEESDNKCECKSCGNMKDCYCHYFESNHMCDKCGWLGHVSYCPNKKVMKL